MPEPKQWPGVPVGEAPGRALCPPWLAHPGRAPPPQGTTASEGTRGQGSCLALPTHLAPASGQQEGMVGAEPRLRGIRIHLPLTVPRGLCKTEGRGYRSFWNPAQTHCLHTHHPHTHSSPPGPGTPTPLLAAMPMASSRAHLLRVGDSLSLLLLGCCLCQVLLGRSN